MHINNLFIRIVILLYVNLVIVLYTLKDQIWCITSI